MITYQRSKALPLAALALAVAGAAGGAYWLWGHEDDSDAKPGVVLSSTKSAPGWIQPTAGNDDPTATLKASIEGDGRPSDIEADDWAALNAALAKHGGQKGEGERIVSYLRFQHGFESWQVLDEAKDAKKRQRMAQALLSELPDRMKSGEFTPIEANLMSAVLLADIETDETKRNQRLEEWQGKLNAIAPLKEEDAASQAQARQTELKRRLATAFAEWQAKTVPSERTPAKLEQSFAEARRAYNSGEF
ncbi:MAG: hypothetical protein Q7U28_16480 [Aquabacterium sp.]|nr:hypothetical protein [Aquabacterium sp.]